MEMDLELGLMVLGLAFVTGIAVYFVSIMGIREKSFEEAIAEQKKRSEDLLGKREKKKPNVKDKTKKQNKKKEREKVAASGDLSDDPSTNDHPSSADQHEHGRHHVEIQDEPEYLDEPNLTESRRASVVRREGIKSILLNKEESSPVTYEREEVEPANHFETSHPKDDAELVHLRSLKKQTSNSGSTDGTPPPSPIVPPLPPRKSRGSKRHEEQQQSHHHHNNAGAAGDSSGVFENVGVVEERVSAAQIEQVKSGRPVTPDTEPLSGRSNASSTKGGGKKAKGRSGSNDQEDMNAAKLETTIDRVPLSSSEIQNLIDILLNKQHAGDSEWINKGKNDTVGTLKKQLLEREKQLAEEQTTVQSLQSTLKKLKTEHLNEKTKLTGAKKQVEDTAAQKIVELQNLQMRLRQIGDVSMGEKQEFQKQLRQLQQRCKDLQDENEALKIDYRNFRENDQGMRAKAESLEREIGALKTQYGHQGNQLQAAFQSNEDLTNQLRSVQEHARSLEERKIQEERQIHAHYEVQMAEKENHLVGELKRLQEILASSETEKSDLNQQILTLQKSSLKNSTETSKAVEEVTKKYEDSQKAEKNTKNLLEDAKAELRSLQEKLKDRELNVKKLEEEKDGLKVEVSTLKEKLTTAESEKINGDVKECENNLNKKLEAQTSQLEKQLEEKSTFLRDLETETKSLKTQVEKSSQDLKTLRDQNEELSSKNSKLVQSLEVKEKSLKDGLAECEKLVQLESSIKETFHKHFPQVTLDKKKVTWAEEFAKSIEEEMKRVECASKSVAVPLDSKGAEELGELQEANGKLKDEVVHYQEVLASTESLLCNLQGSIDKEEKSWREQIKEKDAELAALKSSASSQHANPDLSNLTCELRSEREEKSVLSQRCSELENNIQNLKTQCEEQETLKKRIDDLQAELETERRKHGELLAENSKLQSLFNSSQDSLDKVKQLEAEIAQLKSEMPVGSTNGVSNGSSSPADNKSVSSSGGLKDGGGGGGTPTKSGGGGSSVSSPSSAAPAAPTPTTPSSSSNAAETTPTTEKKKKKKGASAKREK